jgi:hypothetical protein
MDVFNVLKQLPTRLTHRIDESGQSLQGWQFRLVSHMQE